MTSLTSGLLCFLLGIGQWAAAVRQPAPRGPTKSQLWCSQPLSDVSPIGSWELPIHPWHRCSCTLGHYPRHLVRPLSAPSPSFHTATMCWTVSRASLHIQHSGRVCHDRPLLIQIWYLRPALVVPLSGPRSCPSAQSFLATGRISTCQPFPVCVDETSHGGALSTMTSSPLHRPFSVLTSQLVFFCFSHWLSTVVQHPWMIIYCTVCIC